VAAQSAEVKAANDQEEDSSKELSPRSKEIFVGLVGYAGAGCSTAGKRLGLFLSDSGYQVHRVRLSELIAAHFPSDAITIPAEGSGEGVQKLERAKKLQDLGDRAREKYGDFAVAALGVKKIRELRGEAAPGEAKITYIIDSLKHRSEVEFLREVYGEAFRLVAVHCDRTVRENRLIGPLSSAAKFRGADVSSVKSYVKRDEKDGRNDHGQEVRNAFHLADYFLDNNSNAQDGMNLNEDLERFVSLILGAGLVRPNISERSMNHAHAASLQSSCLSRQVGAILVSSAGEVIGVGTNDVPKFGGGVYSEESVPDHRCFAWEWDSSEEKFKGCHNDRKKSVLRDLIASWLSESFSKDLALLAHPKSDVGLDAADRARQESEARIRQFLLEKRSMYDSLPGVKDLIEYSRAIHAEMNAVLSAARSGHSPVGGTLYCTTFPCHNCARHLVNAGVSRVYYVEPYVKSLAAELHSDAISMVEGGSSEKQGKMYILPFTGVGPRMYEDFFTKRIVLKGAGGVYAPPAADVPGQSVRLRELASVEERAVKFISGE